MRLDALGIACNDSHYRFDAFVQFTNYEKFNAWNLKQFFFSTLAPSLSHLHIVSVCVIIHFVHRVAVSRFGANSWAIKNASIGKFLYSINKFTGKMEFIM